MSEQYPCTAVADQFLTPHACYIEIGGQTIRFETGRMARQAHGSVTCQVGETIILSTACAEFKEDTTCTFLPLRVDYMEKFSAMGKTLGGFIKREGKGTEREILISRLIDRPIRPLFPDGFFNEVQLLSYVLSYDSTHPTEPLAICCASAALLISDIPVSKAVGAVRVGMIQDEFIVNPTVEEMKGSKLDLIIAGTHDAILMIEGYCDFLSEEQVLQAISLGHEAIAMICHRLEQWRDIVGKPKVTHTIRPLSEELIGLIKSLCGAVLQAALRVGAKKEREKALHEVHRMVKEHFQPLLDSKALPYSNHDLERALSELSSRLMRQMIVEERYRCDGRRLDQIRPIEIQRAPLPRAHGSTLFTRGETQALAVCTLGSESMAQRSETLGGEASQRFYLQYSFPPFSVGEVGRMGPPGRREIGHGKLAERALMPSVPTQKEFPYVVRLESNILESNGSSSMASVCGGCLAMMDAGVPIHRPVAGIAMGLVLYQNHYTILSDILGVEDALGDMDFKITGDSIGITAFQMDIKVEGITLEIMSKALEQARQGRIHILQKMLSVYNSYSLNLSQHAPRVSTMAVKPNKIASLIGPGGKNIRAITEATGASLEIADSGSVTIFASDQDSLDRAKEMIFGLVAEAELGQIYLGKITRVDVIGAFIEILPGKTGLCHISEWDYQRIEDMHSVAKVGDQIHVKVIDFTEKGIRLSRKALIKH
jgi:polyribonucleotide nucleotidyltransferase